MLSVTYERWKSETDAFERISSSALVRLDNAIKAGNPITAKQALDNWIGEQSEKNQDWRASATPRARYKDCTTS